VLFFSILVLIVFPCRAEDKKPVLNAALGFSLSVSGNTPEPENLGDDCMFGLELGVPLFWKNSPNYILDDRAWNSDGYSIIIPAAQIEYSPFSNLFRVRAGLCFGGTFFFFIYSIGVSGTFVRDFEHNINTLGMAPEIGLDFLLRFRYQMRYEFYADQSYNRFVLTLMYRWLLPLTKGQLKEAK
jgi:hypothetical protein